MNIIWTGPSGQAERFSTESTSLLIGRVLPRRDDQIGLNDPECSSHHARLTIEEGEIWIEDLGSTNGTWVDKKKIKPKTKIRIGPDATIVIGKTTIKVATKGKPKEPPKARPPICPAPAPKSPPAAPRVAAQDTPVRTKPIESVEAGQSLSDLFLSDASVETARTRLSAISDLSESLGNIDSVESAASALLDHLQNAVPQAGRKMHSGLLLGEDLILKAFRPEDEPPTCSLTLARHVKAQKKGCLWQVDAADTVDKSDSLIATGVQSALYVPLLFKGEVLGVLCADAASKKAIFDLDDLKLLQGMANQAALFIKNISLQQTMQREAVVKSRLLAQFPRPIAERLARQSGRLAIVSERVEAVTILFADVRGFTRLAASMEPEMVVEMLNDMFHDLTPIILKNGGTVDKYMGDAVLAVFGSPDPDKEQWEHAIRAALEMQAALKELENERWKGKPAFRVGIGIHTGAVIHGFIGAAERMEYTVIGSTINIASRYCSSAGPGEILISPETYSRLHKCIEVTLPPREIETKHEGKLKAYPVLGWSAKPKS